MVPTGGEGHEQHGGTNFKQVGIAMALVVGGWMVNKGGGGRTQMAIASTTATTTMPMPMLAGTEEITIKSSIITLIPSSQM